MSTAHRRHRPDSLHLVSAGGIAALLGFYCNTPFAQDSPEPDVAISLRGVADGVVEQGEPLRIALILTADGGEIILAPESGTWVDAIEVALMSNSGTALRATPVGKPESATITLDEDRVASGLWRMTPDAVKALAPGDYRVRARLSIQKAAPGSNGWTGVVESLEEPLAVVPASGDAQRRSQRALALAHDALLDERLEAAADIVDELLSEQADDVSAWTVRAVISERAGNAPAALLTINHALNVATRGNDAEGFGLRNVELFEIRRRLESALGDYPSVDVLPDWTWPRVLIDAPLLPLASEPPVLGPGPAIAKVDSSSAVHGRSESSVTTAAASGAPAPATSTPAADSAVSEEANPAAPAVRIDKVTLVPTGDVDEAGILADPAAQWASTAIASSEYGRDRYNAMQATGVPNVPAYSDHPNAWCHSGASVSHEWLELGFASPANATGIHIRQTYTPGTLSKIEAFGVDGMATVLWEGKDPNAYPRGQIGWFVLHFPETEFAVARVRLTLNVSAISGWKQIDAVQLVGTSR